MGTHIHRIRTCLLALTAMLVMGLFVSVAGWGQTTISTGSIVGTITDPSEAVVPGARVVVANKATGQVNNAISNSSGIYSSGALLPGEYTVTVIAKGFKRTTISLNASAGVTSNGDVRLEVGEATMVVEVTAAPVQVDTSEAVVQGTVTPREIEQLPVNGRNFLDLAGLQPGVQIQDGVSFDPTKNGYSSVSFAGRFGRTARIELNGGDISDETVGTTTLNLPQSAIEEFQVEQSSLDLSTELTSSGAINVTTKSGTNGVHGEAFFYGRWHNTAARLAPNDVFFRRAQWGVDVGGPIIKDKVFFFLDWERSRQDFFVPVQLSVPFASSSGGFNGPFREHQLLGRLDWQAKPGWRVFFQTLYNQNRNVAAFSSGSFSPFANVDNTPFYQAGLEGTTGHFTHSIRFQFLHFANAIADAVAGSGIPNPAPSVEIAIGGGLFGSSFASGPNLLAPQATLQHNLQLKYDGSTTFRAHLFRYGFGFNRIQGGGFAKFFGLGPDILVPSVDAGTRAFADAGPFPGGDTNPLNYPATIVIFGNGQGFFTEIPKFGFPAGGQFDTRMNAYFGDSWKIRSNITFNYGIHYVRDTGRSDSDLPAIPALDQFGTGLGGKIQQPNKNFSPIVGLAWDPWKNGKTVFRAGAGLYYENAVFNNVLFDRPGRLPKGLFFGTALACPPPANGISLPNGQTIDTSALCGQPIGSVATQLAADQQAYQAATIAAGAQANGSYVPTTLADGGDSTGNNLIAPNYRTPLSWQFNVGFQRQIKSGTVLSVDFVRNVGLHFLLDYDTTHLGDARFLNTNAALNAISLTNQAFGCPVGTAGIDCAITNGASIVDYAGSGLDSGRSYLAGFPASFFGLTPDTGAAFPGTNPNVGENQMLFPIGRSVYNGLQVQLRQNLNNPFRGVKYMHLIVSYALSRSVSQATDQDFINGVTDQRNINHFIGPNGLDRTHQIAFGGVMDLPHSLRMSFTSKFATALPLTLLLPATGAPGEIFRTDVTGDGTTSDVLPGTNIGSFGRDVSVSNLNNVINSYNNSQSGQLTPAGQALVGAGLFTQQQLIALGAVAPNVGLAMKGQVGNDSFITTDFQLSYLFKPTKKIESLVIEPRVAVYNLFNVANYGRLSGTLDGSGGSANGTTQALRTNRITLGSGVFGFGAPRMLEWGVRFNF